MLFKNIMGVSERGNSCEKKTDCCHNFCTGIVIKLRRPKRPQWRYDERRTVWKQEMCIRDRSKAESNPSSTPQAPAFHVSEYIQLAKNYGQNVGLALDSTATDCWDDPITANANCRYLKRDIQDRLDWYKASGFTAFWVWSEQVGSGEYLIYIGYA